jgi:hypothetical protein
MNQFKLKGTIYGEPRLYGSGEKTVCKALIKAEKSLISITAFKELSRVLYSMAKDEPIEVEGRIQSGSYEKDGKKIYTQDLVIERFKNRNSELDEWMK